MGRMRGKTSAFKGSLVKWRLSRRRSMLGRCACSPRVTTKLAVGDRGRMGRGYAAKLANLARWCPSAELAAVFDLRQELGRGYCRGTRYESALELMGEKARVRVQDPFSARYERRAA